MKKKVAAVVESGRRIRSGFLLDSCVRRKIILGKDLPEEFINPGGPSLLASSFEI